MAETARERRKREAAETARARRKRDRAPNGYVTAPPNQEPGLPGIEALMAPQPGYTPPGARQAPAAQGNSDPGFRPRVEDPDGGGTLDPIGGFQPGTVPGVTETVWQDPASGAIYTEPPPPGKTLPNVPPISNADIAGNEGVAARQEGRRERLGETLDPIPQAYQKFGPRAAPRSPGPGGGGQNGMGQLWPEPFDVPQGWLATLGTGGSEPFSWDSVERMPAWGSSDPTPKLPGRPRSPLGGLLRPFTQGGPASGPPTGGAGGPRALPQRAAPIGANTPGAVDPFSGVITDPLIPGSSVMPGGSPSPAAGPLPAGGGPPGGTVIGPSGQTRPPNPNAPILGTAVPRRRPYRPSNMGSPEGSTEFQTLIQMLGGSPRPRRGDLDQLWARR